MTPDTPPDPLQQILQAKAAVRKEMPDVANIPIEPMGWLDQLIANIRGKMEGGKVQAITHPGSIAYDPSALAGQPASAIGDTLTHELTHVRQARNPGGFTQGLFTGYGQNPNELEAFQAEGDRAVSQGRTPGGTPTFQGGGFRTMGNIELPPMSPIQQALLTRQK